MSERSSQPGEPTPFDRVIRRTLTARPEPPDPSAGCLDAETIASWADGRLIRDERVAAERHAADCARCQAVLAAVATIEPSAEKPGLAAWLRLPALKWIVPATALAAALLVWAVLPNRIVVQHEPAMDTLAENVPRDVPVAPQVAEPPSPASQASAEAGNITSVQEPSVGGRVSALREQMASADAAAPSTSGAPAKPAAPAAVAPAAAPAQFAARALRPEAASVPQVTIVSSNPASRWRTLPGGVVQRSMDGGSTWLMQQTGVTVTLMAGTSPSPSVCWLVGPSGTIVLTTDGRSWRRVAFPEPVDLVAIRSTDDGVAVTTSDGRMFATDDGGATWVRE